MWTNEGDNNLENLTPEELEQRKQDYINQWRQSSTPFTGAKDQSLLNKAHDCEQELVNRGYRYSWIRGEWVKEEREQEE